MTATRRPIAITFAAALIAALFVITAHLAARPAEAAPALSAPAPVAVPAAPAPVYAQAAAPAAPAAIVIAAAPVPTPAAAESGAQSAASTSPLPLAALAGLMGILALFTVRAGQRRLAAPRAAVRLQPTLRAGC